MKKIKTRIEKIQFRKIREAELNAQQMTQSDFNRLVKNIKKDGCLTSAPLIMEDDKEFICISGHHRIRAAIKAGLKEDFCIIIPKVDDSTRTRLQIAHNDIHGTPNSDIVSILSEKLDVEDIELINTVDIEDYEDIRDVTEPPEYKYINLCLLDGSRNSLINLMIDKDEKAENFLIEKEQYSEIKELLSIAFEKGFKTPGQAFGRFLEVIKDNKDLM